ncbi:Short-chain dehydrogenase/reductase SDR [Neofusicoccum parvum]|uniref:Short-chain dehydrogenase/reductase SDR n=1 Tax=Neofusicoccum parvum TaxID=310453 RepID=A0ACB5S2Y1_9PEZI|nr:Short-chain dehydrogenase/reductase SDR [Neofusicoccum parvum]
MVTFFTHGKSKHSSGQVNPQPRHGSASLVQITGDATGIGFAIARAFLRASARTVVLLARRSAVLAEAAAKLRAEFRQPQAEREDERVLAYSCDLNDEARIREVFADVRLKINRKSVPSSTTTEVEDDGELDIDILVLSAAFIEQGLARPQPLAGQPPRRLPDQPAALAAAAAATKKKSRVGGDRVVVDISSVSAPRAGPAGRPRPAAVFTEAAREVGFTEEPFPWDDAGLPAGFAVWLAGARAAFLKGGFVRASWRS